MTYDECLALNPGDILEDTTAPGSKLRFMRIATETERLVVRDHAGIIYVYGLTSCRGAPKDISVLRPI